MERAKEDECCLSVLCTCLYLPISAISKGKNKLPTGVTHIAGYNDYVRGCMRFCINRVEYSLFMMYGTRRNVTHNSLCTSQ